MPAAQQVAGMVADDEYFHVVRRYLALGDLAECGAGPIVARLLGGFDPDHQRACPICVEHLTHPGT
jgi:hypothetical protein